LRYGVELLRQLIRQQRGAGDLGSISFTHAVGYTAFANFLDDYSGPSANVSRVFGAKVFHPDQLHQSYFFQDTWEATPALALTLGRAMTTSANSRTRCLIRLSPDLTRRNFSYGTK
jgi:hypothetical protein